MYGEHFDFYAHQWMMPFGGFILGAVTGVLFALLIIWSLIWKGMALWKSARHADKIWFVVLLVVNTAGILDILYLYFFSKKAKSVE